MKNIVLFCLLVCTNVNLFSQSEKEEILQTFSEYTKHVENKDNAKLVEFLHPGVFEIAPKEMLIEMMDNVYKDTTVFMSFGAMRIDSLTNFMTVESGKYCLIHHNFDLTMQMLPTGDTDILTDELYNSAAATYPFIKQIYGEENVEFDEKNASFKILVASQTFAINDEKTDGWKFIEAKKESHIILKNILPESVFRIVE